MTNDLKPAISDVCDRGACETCFEDEIDACGHECHGPLDGVAAESSTGGRHVHDPAAGVAPVRRRGARATQLPPGSRGWPGTVSPDAVPGSSSSSQPSGRQAARRPDPGPAGADPATACRLPAPSGRGRTRTPAAGVGASTVPAAGLQGRMWTLELPAGLPLLSLNGREHWAARHRKTQALKDAAIVMARKTRLPRLEHVSIVAEYQPPDRRRRDADNPVASVKAAIDGIVAAGCLPGDDSPRYVAEITCRIGPVYPKGRLVLHIAELPPLVAADGAA